jgi:uncharacterized protein YjcR
MQRGGKRPGAGAPKGNLNALKTGVRSRQLKAAIDALATNDETRRLLLAIVEKKRRDRIRFQALMIASAKLIHNAELSAAILDELQHYIDESEGRPPESAEKATKNN